MFLESCLLLHIHILVINNSILWLGSAGLIQVHFNSKETFGIRTVLLYLNYLFNTSWVLTCQQLGH